MRAAVFERYGSAHVVAVAKRPTPTPGDGQVLVRVEAAPVTAADVAARSGSPWFARLYFGLTTPKWPVLGSSYSGTVAAVGHGVTSFAVGDEVWGATGPDLGAHAEYVVVDADGVIGPRPSALSAVDAAAILDGALTALPFLRDGARLAPGQSILITGASGGVGSAAVQLAVHLGAVVTAQTSTPNLGLVRSLGATDTVDYTNEDYTRSGRSWDVVLDAAGKSSFGAARRALAPTGIYLSTVPSAGVLLGMLLTRRSRGRRAGILFTGLRPVPAVRTELAAIGAIIEAGGLRAVVDQSHALDGAAAAHAYVERGHKKGVVLLTM
jgi:NADPH:quinone reductase-like Zn-dependent oxidoreductase